MQWMHRKGYSAEMLARVDAMARQLSETLRGGDLLARFGGDEFVAVGMGPFPDADTLDGAVAAFRQRLFEHSVLSLPVGDKVIHYPGASVGAVAVMPAEVSVEEALNRADASMYAVKRQRRALEGRAGCV